jgi:hypothetical protein
MGAPKILAGFPISFHVIPSDILDHKCQSGLANRIMSTTVLSNGLTSIIATGAVTRTYQYITNGNVLDKTMVFEPQTTPFTPTATSLQNNCTPYIYCPTTAAGVTGGMLCDAYDLLNVTNNYPVDNECYPKDYFGIFWPVSTWG